MLIRVDGTAMMRLEISVGWLEDGSNVVVCSIKYMFCMYQVVQVQYNTIVQSTRTDLLRLKCQNQVCLLLCFQLFARRRIRFVDHFHGNHFLRKKSCNKGPSTAHTDRGERNDIQTHG